jgi:hypothetical protein
MSIDRNIRKEASFSRVSQRLKEEIDSWRPYAVALRHEDREIFRDMMNAVSTSYSAAIAQAERGYDTEALMISILLSQQKTIKWLSNLLEKLRKKQTNVG